VGVPTALVQSAAVMEVVHAAVGWVSSPVGTTAAQVASRLFAVWGVVELYEVVRLVPFNLPNKKSR
jgi:very-long-chain (3R)-3-hydroxyacyl-CoA dehydratase